MELSREEELDHQVSPEEIMSREEELDHQVSLEETMNREEELDHQVSPEEIMNGEVELDHQVSPEEIMNREEELGCGSWTSFTSGCSSTAVQRTVIVTLPSTAVETAIALCTSCCAMARGHRLNTSIVLVAVHGLSNLFWAVSAVEPSLFQTLSPSPPAPYP